MSNVLIDREKIDILANAISAKSGETLPLTLAEMVEAVDGIEQGGAEPNLQAKTYTVDSAGTATVTADSGYDGLSEVEVSVPQAAPYVYKGSQYVTQNNSRKWQVRGICDIDDEGEDHSGYIGLGTYYGNWSTYNAVPANTTVTPTTSAQTIGGANYMMEGAVTVEAMPTGTAGTPTASKGTVSNHSISVTPSVTNTTGYITGGTKTGAAVTVSASELVSGSDTVTSNDTYDVTNLAELVVNVSGSGSVTVTDEANATGTTCVITSGGSPTPSGIPLNTELIDFTKLTEDYAINSSGEAVATQWYCASDYTAVDPSMTFSYTGCRWYYIGVYDSSKEVLRTIYIYNDGTADPDNTNLANGTLSGSELTGASYVRITGVAVQSQYRLSLIRTA